MILKPFALFPRHSAAVQHIVSRDFVSKGLQEGRLWLSSRRKLGHQPFCFDFPKVVSGIRLTTRWTTTLFEKVFITLKSFDLVLFACEIWDLEKREAHRAGLSCSDSSSSYVNGLKMV